MAIMATIKIRAGFLPIEIANYFRESTSSKGLQKNVWSLSFQCEGRKRF